MARRELIDGCGMQVLDEIDVADTASEAAHGYRWRDTYEDFLRELTCGTEQGAVIIDGGRRVSVGETFHVKTRPHEPVALLLRTQSEADLTLSVRVNGRPAGNLVIPRRPGVFTEPFLQIADSLATDSTLTIDVQREPDAAGTGYQSYHYWVLR